MAEVGATFAAAKVHGTMGHFNQILHEVSNSKHGLAGRFPEQAEHYPGSFTLAAHGISSLSRGQENGLLNVYDHCPPVGNAYTNNIRNIDWDQLIKLVEDGRWRHCPVGWEPQYKLRKVWLSL